MKDEKPLTPLEVKEYEERIQQLHDQLRDLREEQARLNRALRELTKGDPKLMSEVMKIMDKTASRPCGESPPKV